MTKPHKRWVHSTRTGRRPFCPPFPRYARRCWMLPVTHFGLRSAPNTAQPPQFASRWPLRQCAKACGKRVPSILALSCLGLLCLGTTLAYTPERPRSWNAAPAGISRLAACPLVALVGRLEFPGACIWHASGGQQQHVNGLRCKRSAAQAGQLALQCEAWKAFLQQKKIIVIHTQLYKDFRCDV